ncbi:MAG: zinc ribbon domain-containing protein [Microcoleaceae cyanobacterium]
MPICPRCQQVIDSQAINCPHCRLELKAFGHPGIPLHRADSDEEFLCTTCAYHADDTCHFPQRPFAQDCTLYADVNRPVRLPQPGKTGFQLRPWMQRNSVWLLLLGLVAVSLFLSLL